MECAVAGERRRGGAGGGWGGLGGGEGDGEEGDGGMEAGSDGMEACDYFLSRLPSAGLLSRMSSSCKGMWIHSERRMSPRCYSFACSSSILRTDKTRTIRLSEKGLTARPIHIQNFDGTREEEERVADIKERLLSGDASKQDLAIRELNSLLQPDSMEGIRPQQLVPLDGERQQLHERAKGMWDDAFREEMVEEEAGEEPADVEDNQVMENMKYGDMNFETAEELIRAMRSLQALPRQGGTLMDLTCRNGELALAASLLHPFDLVTGAGLAGGEE
eukprot:766655-Hanusia_phi.AAC.9